MLIYLVRHAWAGQHGDPTYPDDTQRPLTDQGKKRFRRVVKKLLKRGFAPTAVATSPLVRARETAEIIAELVAAAPPLAVLDDLAPGGRLESLLAWSREAGADAVAWVGHAPDIEEMAAHLIGAGSGQIAFAKGAVAAIRFDRALEAGSGALIWLATAELLRC